MREREREGLRERERERVPRYWSWATEERERGPYFDVLLLADNGVRTKKALVILFVCLFVCLVE